LPPPLPSLRELARRTRESAPPATAAPRDRAPDLATVTTSPLADPDLDFDLFRASDPMPESTAPAAVTDVEPSKPVVHLTRALLACASTFALGAVTMFAVTHWLASSPSPAAAAAAVEGAAQPPSSAPPAADAVACP
jgi:hypothetical protein